MHGVCLNVCTVCYVCASKRGREDRRRAGHTRSSKAIIYRLLVAENQASYAVRPRGMEDRLPPSLPPPQNNFTPALRFYLVVSGAKEQRFLDKGI
jgi:hypothetical protein